MGWEMRAGKRVYYRKVREGGHVRSIYCGAGERAEQAAREDEARRCATKVTNIRDVKKEEAAPVGTPKKEPATEIRTEKKETLEIVEVPELRQVKKREEVANISHVKKEVSEVLEVTQKCEVKKAEVLNIQCVKKEHEIVSPVLWYDRQIREDLEAGRVTHVKSLIEVNVSVSAALKLPEHKELAQLVKSHLPSVDIGVNEYESVEVARLARLIREYRAHPSPDANMILAFWKACSRLKELGYFEDGESFYPTPGIRARVRELAERYKVGEEGRERANLMTELHRMGYWTNGEPFKR